jgi:hypothetical protein
MSVSNRGPFRKSTRLVTSLNRAAAKAMEQLEPRRLLSTVGGGFTDSGLTGQYFSNANLTGSPTFTRRDVRVDFNWGTTGKPGGSISPGFRDVTADNYSVRWTGKVLPKFTETYTFRVIADDGARLMIRPTGSPTWTTIIDQWNAAGNYTATFALTKGQAFDIQLEYRELTGAAQVSLRWSSPSTPEEVIDPIVQTGINNPDWSAGFTNFMMGARGNFEGVDGNPRPTQDANGWPMGNGSYVFQESLNQGLGVDPLMRGRVAFSFNGRATLSLFGNASGLTSSYNAAQNLTTGSFNVVDVNSNASNFIFRNTDRDGNFGGDGLADNDGITNIRLMRPTAPDATTSYPATGPAALPDAPLFTPQLVSAMGTFTAIRFQYVANQQRDWSERTPPTYFNQRSGTVSLPKYGIGDPNSNEASWEHKIMLANESGADVNLSIPVPASGETAADVNSYVYKLAQLVRFGSDANGNPYSAPQANPVYPPLNPNLRVYLELGNELWNFASVFYTDWQNLNEMTEVDIAANNANWAALNYDNLALTVDGSGNYNNMPTWRLRKALQRTMQISDIFRHVWGNDAINNQVRALYQWQYDNLNQTAQIPLLWAERYYNNGTGINHVATPMPISHWLYGGGGATYYAANEPNGLTNINPNPGFDNTTVSNGYTQNPAGTGYTFTGTAGIARDAGGGDDIPTAFNGSQMGYIRDTGAISLTFTAPANMTSNVFAVAFKAHNRRTAGGTTDVQNMRIFIDGTTDITARTFNQGNGVQPPDVTQISPWRARNVFWTESQYYYTRTFTMTPGQTRTITIQGRGDISAPITPDQIAFIEDLRITHVDALYDSGFPGGGEATGQPAGSNLIASMRGQSNWAHAFGLEYVAYEGGWSLGGDDGGSPLQLEAKYRDPRTAGVQGLFMDFFAASGGDVNIHGTYAQWPSWADFFAEQGLINNATYPIVAGMRQRDDMLPAGLTNGIEAPAILPRASANIAMNATAITGVVTSRGGFLNWTVVAPRTGTYRVQLTTTGSSSAELLVNNTEAVTGATGGTLTADVFLTAGIHSVRALNVGAANFTVTDARVTQVGAPAVPTLTSAVDGDATVALNWGAVSGATGYFVRYGTTPGSYPNRIDVGNVTSLDLGGLVNGTQYYFAVSAYNAVAESLPSNERTVIPLGPGQSGNLVIWNLASTVPSTVNAPVTSASGRITVSDLTRASGLVPYSGGGLPTSDAFGSTPVGNVWATTVTAAASQNQFVRFTTQVNPAWRVNLNSITYNAYFQNGAAGRNSALGYSLDGTNFTNVVLTPNNGVYTLNLSTIPALQNVTGTVSWRIYNYSSNSFEYNGIGNISGDDLVISGSFVATAPSAPTGIAATTQSISSIQVTFTDNATNESGFVLDRALDAGFTSGLSSFNLGVNAGTGLVTFVDTGLTPNTQYFYRARAVSGPTASANTGPASATTFPVPSIPTSLLVSALSSTQVGLSWSLGAFNTATRIERSTDGVNFTPLVTLNAPTASHTDTPVLGGTQYSYRLVAIGQYAESVATASQAVTTPLQAPSSAAALTLSTTSIRVTFVDNATTETGFVLERALDAGFGTGLTSFNLAASAGTGLVTYNDTGLTPNTQYFYRARAINALVSSAYTAVVAATTFPVPSATTGLAAVAPFSNRVELSWTVGAFAVSTRIERSTNGLDFSPVATVASPAAVYVDTTTVGNTTYHYRAVTVGQYAEAVPSGVVTVTTPTGPAQLAADTFGSYADGPLFGQTGGTGWAAPWTTTGNSLPAFTVGAASMSYLNLDTGSKFVGMTGGSTASAGRRLSPAAFPGFTTDAAGNITGGPTLYVSSLLRLDRLSQTPAWVGLSSQGTAWLPFANVSIGKVQSANQAIARLGNRIVPMGAQFVQGATNLLVMKIDFAAQAVSYFLNPSQIGGVEPAAGVTIPFASAGFSVLPIRNFVWFGGTQSGDSSLGAVRFGLRYLDVTPTLPGGSLTLPGGSLTFGGGGGQARRPLMGPATPDAIVMEGAGAVEGAPSSAVGGLFGRGSSPSLFSDEPVGR